MSTPESKTDPVIEQKSRIKVTRNAKGDAQWEIAVVDGTTPEEMAAIRTLAVETHQELLRELADPEPQP